jgi:hypothetical protein
MWIGILRFIQAAPSRAIPRFPLARFMLGFPGSAFRASLFCFQGFG